MKSDSTTFNLALLVIDVQNGFMSNGGSYHHLGMKISNYQQIIPKLKELISLCRKHNVPVFYTQAVRELSGIDLLTRSHRILPKAREEKIKREPKVVRETWNEKMFNAKKPLNKNKKLIKEEILLFKILKQKYG